MADEKNDEKTEETPVEETPVEETPAETAEPDAEASEEVSDTEVPETSDAPEEPVSDTSDGVVVSDKADKTIIVKVDVIKSHPKYKKVIRSTVKFHAHDEANTAGVGDKVRIVETRPLSKLKHWRLAEIVEKAK
jgi:small subunit ribosomal protein S17